MQPAVLGSNQDCFAECRASKSGLILERRLLLPQLLLNRLVKRAPNELQAWQDVWFNYLSSKVR